MEPAISVKEVSTKDKRFILQLTRSYAQMYELHVYIDHDLVLINHWSESAYELAHKAMVKLAMYVGATEWNEW